ncbi:MAG TPA: XdhC/CoxI family protein [Bacteroidota bacterium]|nr:XdhC/CoxI family protein [Bacteroidota bacterium]
MNEQLEIHNLYGSLRRAGATGTLATVVKTTGSTYRRPGARMLLANDGRSAGLISGGCLENDLREQSAKALDQDVPFLVTYDASSPADVLWGLGLGCTGVAHVLLERVPTGDDRDPLQFMDKCRALGCSGVITTIYRVSGKSPLRVGDRSFTRSGSWSPGSFPSGSTASLVQSRSVSVLESRTSEQARIETEEGAAEALIEYIPAPTRLLVFGAGPDAIPVVRLAKELGWHVSVIDGRDAFLNPEAFPSADALVSVHPDDTADRIDIPPEAVAVVMTHNFNHDAALVRTLLGSSAAFIGLLGPRSKTDLLLNRLSEDGFVPTESQMGRLHNPVGLDIGAETPEEIALSIVAEIQAVLHGRAGTALRLREGPIHR